MASTAKPPLGIQAGGISTTEGFCAGMGWGRKEEIRNDFPTAVDMV
jgi:hypothetical protein